MRLYIERVNLMKMKKLFGLLFEIKEQLVKFLGGFPSTYPHKI